jgi:hypothetical protein
MASTNLRMRCSWSSRAKDTEWAKNEQVGDVTGKDRMHVQDVPLRQYSLSQYPLNTRLVKSQENTWKTPEKFSRPT